MEKQVTIPSWVLNALKVLGPVVVITAVGYAKFTGMEKDNKYLSDRVNTLEIRTEGMRNELNSLQAKVLIGEQKHTSLEKNITETLIRIETGLKEMQSDVKDLQKRTN